MQSEVVRWRLWAYGGAVNACYHKAAGWLALILLYLFPLFGACGSRVVVCSVLAVPRLACSRPFIEVSCRLLVLSASLLSRLCSLDQLSLSLVVLTCESRAFFSLRPPPHKGFLSIYLGTSKGTYIGSVCGLN